MGVNPRGLLPNHFWQMDVIHVNSVGKLFYALCVYEYLFTSSYCSAHTSEAYKDVSQGLFNCFSYAEIAKHLKADNVPA